jgi:hypothetical protein
MECKIQSLNCSKLNFHVLIFKIFLGGNRISLKALLHYVICLATCLAILLQHKLQVKLQGVSCHTINKSRNIFVATTIAQSRIRFYFLQRCQPNVITCGFYTIFNNDHYKLHGTYCLVKYALQCNPEIVFLNIARQVPRPVA